MSQVIHARNKQPKSKTNHIYLEKQGVHTGVLVKCKFRKSDSSLIIIHSIIFLRMKTRNHMTGVLIFIITRVISQTLIMKLNLCFRYFQQLKQFL